MILLGLQITFHLLQIRHKIRQNKIPLSESSSSSFYVHFSMLARVGRPPHMHPLHFTRSSAQSLFKPSETISFLTHSPHVFLLLPFRSLLPTSKSLQADTQSSGLLRSR